MRDAGEVVYADVFKNGTAVCEFKTKDDMQWALKNLNDTKFKSHEVSFSPSFILIIYLSYTLTHVKMLNFFQALLFTYCNPNR